MFCFKDYQALKAVIPGSPSLQGTHAQKTHNTQDAKAIVTLEKNEAFWNISFCGFHHPICVWGWLTHIIRPIEKQTSEEKQTSVADLVPIRDSGLSMEPEYCVSPQLVVISLPLISRDQCIAEINCCKWCFLNMLQLRICRPLNCHLTLLHNFFEIQEQNTFSFHPLSSLIICTSPRGPYCSGQAVGKYAFPLREKHLITFLQLWLLSKSCGLCPAVASYLYSHS